MVIFVADEKAEERFSICKQCPSLNDIGICGECGCNMPFKIKVAISKCPKGKW